MKGQVALYKLLEKAELLDKGTKEINEILQLTQIVARDLQVLETLKGLFIERQEYECPYYELGENNKLCVDSNIEISEIEKANIKVWLKNK